MKRKLAAAAALVGAAAAGLLVAFSAFADNGSPMTGHIGICHHTGNSQAHEWVYIEPDASGVFAGHAGSNHQDREDIIPAFTFVDAQGVSHSYAGQNLTTRYDASLEPSASGEFAGAAILAAHCVTPRTTTQPSTTVTPPVTTTVTTPSQTVTRAVTVTSPSVTTTVTTPAQTVTNTQTVTTPGKTKVITKRKIVVKRVTVPARKAPKLAFTK